MSQAVFLESFTFIMNLGDSCYLIKDYFVSLKINLPEESFTVVKTFYSFFNLITGALRASDWLKSGSKSPSVGSTYDMSPE